jgi:hypothetical protein
MVPWEELSQTAHFFVGHRSIKLLSPTETVHLLDFITLTFHKISTSLAK